MGTRSDVELAETSPGPSKDAKDSFVGDNSDHEEPAPWLQARYLVVLAAFFANAVGYIMRVNLSVAIVAIALEDGDLHPNSTLANPSTVPQYDWNEATRSVMLSSFFWGYIVTQVPSGHMAQRYGPRRLLFVLLLICSVVTLLFVPAAALGWEWACASRVVLGLAQGGLLPCCHALIARWAPPNERGRMVVYAYSGQPLGTVIALSGSGLVASSTSGWPAVFYVSGALGLVTSVVWLWLVADSPAQHRLASPHERRYIHTSIGGVGEATEKPKRLDTPWGSILTSMPFLALLIAHSVQNWGFWTLLTQIPSYMSGVLNFHLKENGFLSALPYLAMWGSGLVLSLVSDLLLKRECCSVGTSRKLGNSLGHYGSAIALILLGYVGADATVAVVLLTLALACNAGTMIGYQVNHIDLSPNFAGTMMGITNCIGNIMSILGPLLVGFVVTNNENEDQWRIVFLIAAGFFVVGNTIFVVFGSGTVQPWNDPLHNKDESDSSSSGSAGKMHSKPDEQL